ncbi:hypothetical protein [Devosia sp.]|uniref:hypothetical protein n=1 Tax=Devosia sp. TaxID=1871048 RepID=UPI0025F6CFDA|nr:hypothetical protein [Devosia sp.]MCR6636432.1 hypothetical protein [Devosia sp.]
MNILIIIAGLAVALLMAGGQLALKGVANLRLDGAPIFRLIVSWQFILAILAYGSNVVLWLWVLTQLPLSTAYPFALFGSAMVPLGAAVFLKERLSPKFAFGFTLIMVGMVLAISGGSV